MDRRKWRFLNLIMPYIIYYWHHTYSVRIAIFFSSFYCLQKTGAKKKDQSVLELLRRNDQAKHPKGETLPHDMRLYRFDLIQSFLTAGIPLSKIDCLRSFLEKYGHWLTLRVT